MMEHGCKVCRLIVTIKRVRFQLPCTDGTWTRKRAQKPFDLVMAQKVAILQFHPVHPDGSRLDPAFLELVLSHRAKVSNLPKFNLSKPNTPYWPLILNHHPNMHQSLTRLLMKEEICQIDLPRNQRKVLESEMEYGKSFH